MLIVLFMTEQSCGIFF